MGSRYGEPPAERAVRTTVKWPSVHILPCTVSHILNSDLSEVNQVSVVGVVIRQEVDNILYLDDMTAAPLMVKHYLDTECGILKRLPSPGTYVKVLGTVQTSQGKMRILAKSVRSLDDLNEVTSHMLEVVQARLAQDVTLRHLHSQRGCEVSAQRWTYLHHR